MTSEVTIAEREGGAEPRRGFFVLALLSVALLSLLPPLWTIGLAAALALSVAAVAVPALATCGYCFLLYSNAAVIAVHFHGVPLAAGALLPCALLVPCARALIIERKPLIAPRGFVWMLAFLFSMLLGGLFSADFEVVQGEVVEFLIEGLFVYLLLVNSIRSKSALRGAVWATVLAGACMGAISLHQQLTDGFDSNYGGFGQIEALPFGTGERTMAGEATQHRLAGPVGEKNRYAQIMLVLVPLALFRFWGERRAGLRALAAGALLLILAGFALAFSRGAAVALVLLFACMVVMRTIPLRRAVLVSLLGAGALFALPQYRARLVTLPSMLAFLGNTDQGSGSPDGAMKGRVTEMLAAVLMYADHPVLGVGAGMFGRYVDDYGNDLGIRRLPEGRQAHCLYLHIAAEYGTAGLACFLGLAAWTLRELLAARRRASDPELQNLCTALFLAVVGYLTTGIFLHLSYARYFWFVMALAAAAICVAREDSEFGFKRAESVG